MLSICMAVNTCQLKLRHMQEWDKLVAKALGPKYVKLASESLMAISILVYVRLKLHEHLTAVATSYVATGTASVVAAPAVAITWLTE